MATTTNIKKVSLGEFFVGQGDIVMWDEISSYASATLASFQNGRSVGNVKEDSTNWTGEDVSETVIRNEQGNPIATITTAGTLAFEMTLADFSLESENDLAIELLKGANISISTLTVPWLKSVGTATAMGFGVDLNTTVSDLMRVASLSTGIIGSLPSMIQGLSNSFNGQKMLQQF